MLNRIFLAMVTATCGCSLANENDATRNAPTRHQTFSIPFEHPAGIRDGYLLKVPGEGPFLWNGMPVEATTASSWVREYARQDAGRLWIEFEPGVPVQRREWLLRQVIDSGLCKQRRCVETDWNAKWSVVN